jgi:hypothetical protein
LEETDVNEFQVLRNVSDFDEGQEIQTKSLLLSAKEAPETIALPGGCLLSEEQYRDLLLFRKNQHVSSW